MHLLLLQPDQPNLILPDTYTYSNPYPNANPYTNANTIANTYANCNTLTNPNTIAAFTDANRLWARTTLLSPCVV